MKSRFQQIFLLALAGFLVAVPSIAFAHGMFLKLVEPGVLKVEYDGGGFSSRTQVTIYDEAGNELGSGTVDENGEFHFEPELDVHRAIADDGMGHRAEYKKGVETTTLPKAPIVIGVLAAAAVIYLYYDKKGKNTKEQ